MEQVPVLQALRSSNPNSNSTRASNEESMARSRKSRSFRPLGNRGWSMLEVLIGAVIVGLTIPFAASNFTTNLRVLDDTRVSASIDQLDETLANNVTNAMLGFFRRIAYSNFKTGK